MKKNKKIIIIAVVAVVLWLLYKRSNAMPVTATSIASGGAGSDTGTGSGSSKTLLQKYNDEVARWKAASGGDLDMANYNFWQNGVSPNSPLSDTDKTLVRWVREIMNTPEWKSSVQEKATQNGVTFETQIGNEARYMMSTQGEPPYPN